MEQQNKNNSITMFKKAVPIMVCIVLIFLDQLTKQLIVNNLDEHEVIPFINGILSITFETNTGAAFSFLEGATWFFIILTLIVVIVIIIYYIRIPNKKPQIYLKLPILFVISGAIGNFADRLFRGGHVIDFLKTEFMSFPIFNLADCYISVGAFLIVILMIFVIKE